MTEQEALNYLKHNCRKMCQDCYPEIGRGGSENCDFCNEASAYDMAIQAFEKQIPKKPARKGYRDGCPICSVVFPENDFGIRYCWNCGTKLDWSDSND